MKRPIDVENYALCIRITRGMVWVWCVECDDWWGLAYTTMARLTLTPHRVEEVELDKDGGAFHCRKCGRDVTYLFRDNEPLKLRAINKLEELAW